MYELREKTLVVAYVRPNATHKSETAFLEIYTYKLREQTILIAHGRTNVTLTGKTQCCWVYMITKESDSHSIQENKRYAQS